MKKYNKREKQEKKYLEIFMEEEKVMEDKSVKTTVSKNKNGYGYKYTDLAQIHEYLESINAIYIQQVKRIENDDYVMTKRCFNDVWEDEWLQGAKIVDAVLNGIKNPAQEQGSALTYARRYSLLMAFGLATEDDDGKKIEKRLTKEEQELMYIYLDKMKKLEAETNTEHEELLKHFKVDSDINMNLKQLKEAVAILEVKKKKSEKEVF